MVEMRSLMIQSVAMEERSMMHGFKVQLEALQKKKNRMQNKKGKKNFHSHGENKVKRS